MAIALNSRVVRLQEPVAAEVGDTLLMFSVANGEYYGFNDSATTIWPPLQAPTTVAALCATLQQRLGEGGRSINSDYVAYSGGSLYVMTKAAVVGLTKGLARDLGPRGITINIVQPGPTDTDMNPASGDFAK